jgi:sugar phosphate isomerase/epimerase
MSQLVVATWVVGADLTKDLDLLQRCDIHLIEVLASATGEPDLREAGVVAQIRERLAERGQRVHSVHSAFGAQWDLDAPQVEERDLALRHQTALLRGAGALDAAHVVLHGGELPVGAPTQPQLERFLRSLEQLLPVAEEAGVLIALENLPPDHLCRSLEQLAWLLERLDPRRVGFCCDTGHAELTGTPASDFVRQFRDRLLGVHLHDNHGDSDAHLFPGLGGIDWEGFFGALREVGYTLPLTLEALPPSELPLQAAADIARRCVEELQPPDLQPWLRGGRKQAAGET